MTTKQTTLTTQQTQSLLSKLQDRFEKNESRHTGITWSVVESRLIGNPNKLWSLFQMEETGGEPDVVAQDKESGVLTFFDCAKESPKARTSLCYDRAALESRKNYPPKNSALDLAHEMGIQILNEEQYQFLQKLGNFDTKTSSWIHTPDELRILGGALFGDFRYGRVFIYHNGAQSYYAGRGFRGFLLV